ncbi:hypothetical protein BJ166DRAFT_518008 [Pestalotiopsis sp. NC0098]|nr:hypothetical protein BJ166DRAFT_518008 [Pestalotiopsis sp. NC0098]
MLPSLWLMVLNVGTVSHQDCRALEHTWSPTGQYYGKKPNKQRVMKMILLKKCACISYFELPAESLNWPRAQTSGRL